jgi:conjugal transfer pilus assembly protein TraE
MKLTLKEKRLSHIQFQRNLLAGLSMCLLTVTVLQTTLLFFKTEKTIINPPELKQSYWVEGNTFSPAYLEEMALYFSHLLLDVSAANVLYQGDVLLRYVASNEYGHFKAKLLEEQKRLKAENVSLNFNPVDCVVVPGQMTVDVNGDLHTFVSDKKISQHRETYRVVFTGKAGRLFLKSFQLIKTAHPEENKNDATS